MLLTKDEKNRIEIIQAVIDGKLDVEDAATLLSLSVRQIYRLIARVDQGSITSILHANKGRVASNKIADQLWERILLLVKQRYQGINDRHLQEILKREHSIEVGREISENGFALKALLQSVNAARKSIVPAENAKPLLAVCYRLMLHLMIGLKVGQDA